ncbi:hypothetical protein [Streptosporangium sp. LJ11]|uniref:hypothetical protein n=1 Tax=Streptosporangium sp. LJ11 TaxID=3436927 RepID=UPI003F7B1155
METLLAVFAGIAAGMFINELGELSPWAARKFIRFAARLAYRDHVRAVHCSSQLNAMLEDVPGKATQLVAALMLGGACIAGTLWRGRVVRRLRARLHALAVRMDAAARRMIRTAWRLSRRRSGKR